MHLNKRVVAVWLVAAVLVAVAAFLIGRGGASPAKASSSAAPAIQGPHPMAVPNLVAVTPLPSMKEPRPSTQPVEETSVEEVATPTEATPEYESYEQPAEESTSTPTEESSSSSQESAPPAEESSSHTEAPQPAEEEVITEG